MQREDLIRALSMAAQRSGNLNVLLTHSIAEQVGLSATEFESLDVLGERGPLTAGQLARCCGLSTGGVTGMIDRLEKAGFVKRAADAHDRRKVMVERIESEELRRKVIKLYLPLHEAFMETVSRYSDAELATILDFIERTNANMTAVHPELWKGPQS